MIFARGDLVRVATDLGSGMGHFTSDCDAIVCYSYEGRYGGGETVENDQYGIHLKGHGVSAWYPARTLRLIERGRQDLLEQWQAEQDAEREEKGNLDWIFANSEAVLESAHGASVEALARCFGLNNLWGSRGEGLTWYTNALQTIALARPFLLRGDKAGYLQFCEEMVKAEEKA